ncbi:MAG TPA: hypothetical protein PK047_13515, partial [Saprospiraceae bacterium]|nr:hypothetical protein [Saprospiraceae bacterium]HRP43114.1 hypothetical protein [Saprospiraceae bacterium]
MSKFWLLQLILLMYSSLMINAQSTLCPQDTQCHILKRFDSNFEIKMEKQWESKEYVAQFGTPVIQDIDGDCKPEILIAGYQGHNDDWVASKEILIYDAEELNLKYKISTAYFFVWKNSFVVLSLGNESRVIVACADVGFNNISVRNKLVCYNMDGSIYWISDQKFGNNVDLESGYPSLADFNQDGIPEVFIHNEIFNAETGVKLVDGGKNGCGVSFHSSNSISANLDDDPSDLELAAGYTIYKVQIINTNGMTGNQMIPYNMMIDGKLIDGQTSVIDMNLDGQPDVFVFSAGSGYTYLYIYSFKNNKCELKAQYSFNEFKLFGNLCIGNIDHNPEPDIIIVSSDTLRKFTYNNTPFILETWKLKIMEGSGYAGVSMFDFNGDGIQEIVVRDEEKIMIISEINGIPVVIAEQECISGTSGEMPIIAGINNNNDAIICVTCANLFEDYNGRLTIFGPPEGQRWAPARKIWHQYNYNPLFI